MDKSEKIALAVVIIGILILVTIGAFIVIGISQYNEWDAKSTRVEQCLASEQFTREECIILVGSPK